MRFIGFLVAVLILTGCAHNRIRLVKSDRHQTIVNSTSEQNKSDNPFEKEKIEFYATDVVAKENKDENQYSEDVTDDFKAENVVKSRVDNTSQPADTIRIDSDEFKVIQAQEAESNALKARNLFIITLGMMVLPIVSLFALIPFIIGSVRLARAKNSQYITEYGQKQQRIATILQWIYAGILILGLLLTAVVLVILFL